jgi:Family of unknown function (DUF5329)
VPGIAACDRRERALISGLGGSGCVFERNGRWYDAKAAQAHLRKKYDYLRKRELAATAELFIERGASNSSISGKPYRVRCGDASAVSAARWFGLRLRELRSSAGS